MPAKRLLESLSHKLEAVLHQLPRDSAHGPPAYRHQPTQSLQNPQPHLRARRGLPPARRIPARALSSAEVQGHGNPILQFGKINVGLSGLEPAGQYALKLTFDDGHDSGLFTWEYLEQLCLRQEQLWAEYLDELHKAGKSRDPAESVVKLML
ncbi:hypothetical protein PshuTeo2_23920 [Pseudomonas hunanensis]|nr:hypothetical protein [Pseudomonas hunanensis]